MLGKAASGVSTTLTHKMLNKLSIIIGSCELVQEIAEREHGYDGPCVHRLLVIRHVAEQLAEDVKQHRFELDSIEMDAEASVGSNAPSKVGLHAIDSDSNPLKVNG
jgi:hypothetical protein